jgi:hypothetical protein
MMWIDGTIAGINLPVLLDPKAARSRMSYSMAEKVSANLNIHSIPAHGNVKVLLGE